MKTEKNHPVAATMKMFILLPLIVFALIVFCSCGKNRSSNAGKTEIIPTPALAPALLPESKTLSGEPYIVVDVMPKFPGGDAALFKYLAQNTVYPEESKAKGIQGRVIVKFVIEVDGSIKLASIEKGADPALDKEALRVVQTLPKFYPGQQGGKPVPVWYRVPITFTLN